MSKVVTELERKMQYLPISCNITRKYDSLLESEYIHLDMSVPICNDVFKLWSVKRDSKQLCKSWNNKWNGAIRTLDSLASYRTVNDTAIIDVDIVPAETGCTGDIDVLAAGLSSLCKSFYSLTKD